MSVQGTIKRYSLIIEKVSRKSYPSLDELHAHLVENGFELSERTLQRNIDAIRNEFGVEIVYDRDRSGYFIDEELSLDYASFLKLVEISNTADLIVAGLSDGKEALAALSFEARGDLRGIDNLKPLYTAIKNQRIVSFHHENFGSGQQKEYTVQPYLLKEYQERWYLVGRPEGGDEFLNFGLERITELLISDRKSKREDTRDPKELFDHTIGITYSVGDAERVILSFTPLQGKYVKTLPYHSSQQVLVDNDEELRIALTVVPNFELTQKILMLGDNVRVLEPQSLKDEVRRTLRSSLDRYDTL